MDPVTGVFSGNDVSDGFWTGDETDLDFESWREENPDADPEDYQCDSPDLLVGDWRKVNGKWQPNKSGKQGFAAIFNGNYNTIQVVWSKTKVRCNRCSPCYPGQGDADTDGSLVAYSLPVDCLSDEWLQEHAERLAMGGKRLSWGAIQQMRKDEQAGYDIIKLWLDRKTNRVCGMRRNGGIFNSLNEGSDGMKFMRKCHPAARVLKRAPRK